jgi:hypothetical protein
MLKRGPEILQKRMLLGKFEVTWAVIQFAENTGSILYRQYIVQAHDSGDI